MSKKLFLIGSGTNTNCCLGSVKAPNHQEYYEIEIPRGVNNIREIITGTSYSAFIDSEGRIYEWGRLTNNKKDRIKDKPTLVKFFVAHNEQIIKASCRNMQVAAISCTTTNQSPNTTDNERNEYKIYVWGDNQYKIFGDEDYISEEYPKELEIPNDTKPISISCGGHFILVLMENGTVYSMGLNYENGPGLDDTDFRDDRIIKTLTKIPNLQNIISISAGWSHSCALTNDNLVFTWGRSSFGRLGHTNSCNISQICNKKIQSISNKNPIKIDIIGCSHTSTFICDEEDKIYSCGWNYNGENGVADKLCHRSMSYVIFDDDYNSNSNQNHSVKEIIGGAGASFVLTNDGKVYGSGSNKDNVLLLGNNTSNTTTMKKLNLKGKVKLVSVGFNHALFVLEVTH